MSRCIVVMQDPWVVGKKFGPFPSNFFTQPFQYFQIVNLVDCLSSWYKFIMNKPVIIKFANFIVSYIYPDDAAETLSRSTPIKQICAWISLKLQMLFFVHEFHIRRILIVNGNCLVSICGDPQLCLRSGTCVILLCWRRGLETGTDYDRQT